MTAGQTVLSAAMNALTIKLPANLDAALQEACAAAHLKKSELVRRALVAYLQPRHGEQGESALVWAGDLVGCFADAPEDLSSNPNHLDAFGRV